MSDISALLSATRLWIVPQPRRAERPRCRDYHVCDARGATLLSVRALLWGRDISGSDPLTGEARLVVRRHRLFPFTGRADVLELPGERRLGGVHRSGRFADATGRVVGRFRDARSLRARAAEGVFQATLEAVLGGDGSSSYPAGPQGFVWIGPDGAAAGTLSRRELDFASRAGSDHASGGARPAVAFGSRVRGMVRAVTAPRGWLLERPAPGAAADALLVAGAALFAVELSHW